MNGKATTKQDDLNPRFLERGSSDNDLSDKDDDDDDNEDDDDDDEDEDDDEEDVGEEHGMLTEEGKVQLLKGLA